MALEFLRWELMLLEERVRVQERRIERRVLRDTQDPFDLPREEFVFMFRISHELAFDVINAIRALLQGQRSSGLSPEVQFLVTVHFYAQGSYQRGLGGNSILNISQPSVSRSISGVTNAINQRLLRQWVKFPMTAVERQKGREKFEAAPQPFEGTLGAIDCTHINILAPIVHEEAYVNHHGNHSLNVQAIVDPDLKILNINARYPGARNDSYIWSVSAVRQGMEYHFNNGERRTWLIGDAGYPLEPWLMTPLPHYPEGTHQFEYTKKLCKARNVVERFFGVFKSVWRCLSYQRVLMYAPDKAGRIVNACATLHNTRIHYKLPNREEDLDVELIGQNMDANLEIPYYIDQQGGPRAVAKRIQRQILDQFDNLRDREDD
ncbi:putative nuclease HARBI1 [Acyrthosiphon pisum]|uniref:DDE Tnp4 domain-containing protein n=1 Tax=Acyrthosiphon pisum TaxID=7029 RepID=A0A8R1X148_ACYPI|nr:putative nuclease HARBI1 [Acyrthosiphon pisum]|eukprot:XP_008179536.1 PREDICTED: putative nuclease HARBI1 [Acyrthosiphon pisum]